MQPSSAPIIVKIVEEPVRGLGLGGVILNAVGLTGALALAAVALGLIFAAVFIGFRRARSRRLTEDEAAQTQSLGLTPTAHQ